MVAKLKIKMNAAQFEHRLDYYFTRESSLLLIYCKKLFILQTSLVVYVIGGLLASERSERDTLRSVQLRIADIYIIIIMYSTCKFCSYNP